MPGIKFLRDANNRILTDYNGKIILVRDSVQVKSEDTPEPKLKKTRESADPPSNAASGAKRNPPGAAQVNLDFYGRPIIPQMSVKQDPHLVKCPFQSTPSATRDAKSMFIGFESLDDAACLLQTCAL